MKFNEATIVFQNLSDEETESRPPHSDVEILENGWVKVVVTEEDGDDDVEVYYPPNEIRRIEAEPKTGKATW